MPGQTTANAKSASPEHHHVGKMCNTARPAKIKTKCESTRRNGRKTRIVRSITATPSPIISKHLIDVGMEENEEEEDEEEDEELESSGSSSALQNQKSTESVFDRIVRKLQRDTWPADVIILITPSSRHKKQYKLHLIDRHGQGHLCMTSITQKELVELRTSRAFRQYSTVLSTKYLDLKTVAIKTAIIDDLVHTLDGDCCRSKCYFIKTRSPSKEIHDRQKRAQTAAICEYQQQQQYLRDFQEYRDFQDIRHVNDARLVALLTRINTAIDPIGPDLEKFFALAERYKFKMYIRPELCWKTTTELERDLGGDIQRNLARFNVEFFMLFDNYVGGITLDGDQLREKLAAHVGLLPRVEIINDVCEITPLPRVAIWIFRTICTWLGMEMMYDAFGEFIFDLYKHYS